MISSRIKKVGEEAKVALGQLKEFQNGKRKLLLTGYSFLDDHMGGVLPGSIVTIAGSSGTGKTYLAHKILENIMSTKVNPDADDFVSLEYSFEMLMLNKVMRSINQKTKLSRKEILTKQFCEEHIKIVNDYYSELNDDRRYVSHEPTTVDIWYEDTKSFCEHFKHKKAILISIDHLVLFKGSEKQKNIERATDYQNELKLMYPNLYFFNLSQLNRESSFSGVKDRSNDVVPNNTWLYASSLIEMISDYIIILANPFKSGITEFMSFNPARYEYLSEFYAGEDNKGKQSFATVGNIFYFVTKVRDSDVPYENIHIERMDITSEMLNKMKQDVQKEESATMNVPTFVLPSAKFSEPGMNAFNKASWNKEPDDIIDPPF